MSGKIHQWSHLLSGPGLFYFGYWFNLLTTNWSVHIFYFLIWELFKQLIKHGFFWYPLFLLFILMSWIISGSVCIYIYYWQRHIILFFQFLYESNSENDSGIFLYLTFCIKRRIISSMKYSHIKTFWAWCLFWGMRVAFWFKLILWFFTLVGSSSSLWLKCGNS